MQRRQRAEADADETLGMTAEILRQPDLNM
jgi:hypothetical protein